MAIDIADIIDKLPPIRIPGLHSSDSIGIDIGSHSIKIVQLKNVSGKFQLIRWSVIPAIPVGETDKTESSPEEKKIFLVNLLKTYRGSGKNIPKNAVIAVSGTSVIVRYVKFQKLTRKELSKTIKAEAEPYIPFNVEEVYIGFHPLKDVTEEGKQKMETVLVAAKKDFVNQRIEMIEESGFKPAIIDVDAFALESSYELSLENTTTNETVLIANIGYSKTNFVILENGVSVVVKDSPIAGNSINKNIMKTLGVDSRTAEKLKNSNGILLSIEEKEAALTQNQKEALAVSEAMTLLGKDLGNEIKKIIQYHITQGKDKKIDRIILSGGSSNIKNFVNYLYKELNISVEKLNLFSKILNSSGIPEEYQTTLAIATGLAMRKPGDIND